MAWTERIREAAYTSPSGVRTAFDYENVGLDVDKKTTAFNFPDADGTYVQDLGHSGRRYPLRIFFWGEDHDETAEAFMASLLESGAGRLEHPLYGVVDVVPFGAISRRDNLKTAANQSVLEVEFWETLGLVYPSAVSDPSSEVLAAVNEYNDAAAAALEADLELDDALDAVTFKNTYQGLFDSAKSGLQAIADAQADVRQKFEAVAASIDSGLDVFVQQPLTLAFQTLTLIQTPALVFQGVTARLDAYKDLAGALLSGDGAEVKANDFYTSDLYASTYVSGAIVSAVNAQFATKTDALTAADDLLSLFADVADWRDANYRALGAVDTGTSYQQLQEAVAVAAGFLVQISFTLKQERRLVLTEPRTIVDLAGELFGSVDTELDFLIESNNLSGSEILELPRGREIVYYL